MKSEIAFIAILAIMLAGCGSIPMLQPRSVVTNEQALSPLYGKKLTMDCGYTIINNDGTLIGEFNKVQISGTWKFEENLWCRTITEGPDYILKNAYDCQPLEMSKSRLYGVLNRGAGEAYFYKITP